MSRTTLEERVTMLEKRLAQITNLLARAMADPGSKKRTTLNGRKGTRQSGMPVAKRPKPTKPPSATLQPRRLSESRPLTYEDLRRLAERFPPPTEWFDEDFDGLF